MISWYIFQNTSVSICAKPFWLSIDSEQFVRRGSATPKLLESLGLRHLGMSIYEYVMAISAAVNVSH